MAAQTRRTYKQELIDRISGSFRRTSIPAIPATCLRDMSTSSLAAFEEWLEPLIKEHPPVTPSSHQLPAKRTKRA